MGGEIEETYESLKTYARAIKGDDVFAEQLLREAGVPPVVGKLTEERIVAAVAAGLGVRLEDLASGSRQRVFSRARLIAAYLGRGCSDSRRSWPATHVCASPSPGWRPTSKDNTGSTRLTPSHRKYTVDPKPPPSHQYRLREGSRYWK